MKLHTCTITPLQTLYSLCSTSGICHVTVVQNPVISHGRKEKRDADFQTEHIRDHL